MCLVWQAGVNLTFVPAAMGNGARRAVAALVAHDIDPQPLLSRVGLVDAVWADRDALIPAEAEARLIELAAEALCDPLFGLRLAEAADPKETGLVYYLLSAASNVREAVNLTARYIHVVNAGIRWLVASRPDGGAALELRYVVPARTLLYHTTEYHLAMFVRHLRQIVGRHVSPTFVTFAHNRTSGTRALERYFACPVAFSQGADQFVMAKEALDAPIPQADRRLFEVLQPHAERAAKMRAAGESPFREAVESKLYRALPGGEPNIETIAAIMATTSRTLGRRLSAEGATFSGVLDDLRRTLALQYLKDPQLDLSQISWLLGYEGLASFSHAFRRWTGTSPSHFRDHPGEPEEAKEATATS